MSAIHLHGYYLANVIEGVWAEGKKDTALVYLLHHQACLLGRLQAREVLCCIRSHMRSTIGANLL